MKINDFIDSECQKFEHLDDNIKAMNVLESVKQEIKRNDNNKIDINAIRKAALNTIDTVSLMNRTEYVMELMVAKYLLEYYIKTSSFKVLIKPFPNTEADNLRYHRIKEHLQNKFK